MDRVEYFTNGVPNPGSDEAEELGCECARSDNHYGLGFPFGADHTKCFWINGNCPLHGSIPKEVNSDDS